MKHRSVGTLFRLLGCSELPLKSDAFQQRYHNNRPDSFVLFPESGEIQITFKIPYLLVMQPAHVRDQPVDEVGACSVIII